MPDRHAALKLAARLQDFHTKYLAATMAVVLIIGPFFAGHLRPAETTRGRASMLANMRYHTAVIISLFTALGSLASSSRKLMRLGAHAERILELEDTAKEISAGMPAGLVESQISAFRPTQLHYHGMSDQRQQDRDQGIDGSDSACQTSQHMACL